MYHFKRIYRETFWIANEALNVSYAWGPGAGGAIGFVNPIDSQSFCGALLHFDHAEQPLWLNGGVVKQKAMVIKETIRFQHFAIDRTFRNQNWYIFYI